jgi:serine/threonine protein phosphatase PrpC
MSDIPVPGQPVILFAEQCAPGALSEQNQDSVLHVRIALGDLLVVAGGIGEDTGGATASRMVVEYFYAHLASLPSDYPPDHALREAAALANEKIQAAVGEPGSPHPRMGSTVVAALLQQGADGPFAWVGHIGHSRAYLLRAGRLHRLTTDHSAVQTLLSRNLITPQEALDHPEAFVSTRFLGQSPEVEIDIEQHALAVDDTLLLCSSGLWGHIPVQKIQKTMAAPGLTLETAAHNLLGLALATRSREDIGIEMLRLVPPRTPDPPQKEKPFPGLKWILAVFLLALAGLFVLAYLTFF